MPGPAVTIVPNGSPVEALGVKPVASGAPVLTVVPEGIHGGFAITIDEINGVPFVLEGYNPGGSTMFNAPVIVLAMGQSNEAGSAGVGTIEPNGPDSIPSGILTWAVNASSAVPTAYPIPWPAPSGGSPLRGPAPAVEFAKLVRPNVREADPVIIIPAAVGETALYNSVWSAPSGTLYAQAKSALVSCLSAYPGSKVVVLWTQGEQDANNGTTRAQYAAAFNNMVADLRTVSGAQDAKVMVHGMVPEWVTLGGGTRGDVARALSDDVSKNANSVYFCGINVGYAKVGDTTHFDAPGSRRSGQDRARLWLNLERLGTTFQHDFMTPEGDIRVANFAITDQARKIYIDKMYFDLKNGRVFGNDSISNLDSFLLFKSAGSEAEALSNWVSGPNARLEGGVTLTPDGMVTDGVSGAVRLGINPATTPSLKYGLNNGLFGILNEFDANMPAPVAGAATGASQVSILPRINTALGYRVNQAAATSRANVTDGSGVVIVLRATATQVFSYLRGVGEAAASNSNSVPNDEISLGENNAVFSATTFGGAIVGRTPGGASIAVDLTSAIMGMEVPMALAERFMTTEIGDPILNETGTKIATE